jgi:hypothetical protein
MLARAGEDRVPGLFAAFMATADAAVDAREASGTALISELADLAPTRDDLRNVLAAVHHAVDALARIVVEDTEAVRTAAGQRLYLPTRLMPADCDIPTATSLPRDHESTPFWPRTMLCSGQMCVLSRRGLAFTCSPSELDTPGQLATTGEGTIIKVCISTGTALGRW